MKHKLLRFLVLFFFFTSVLGQAQDDLLASKDVNKIMKQILDQHVDKNKMTNEILKNSFKIYIEQFDPERVYLLESEVNPYLNLSDAELKQIMAQYEKNDLSAYKKLNDQIQKAIYRAQEMRKNINQSELIQQSTKLAGQSQETPAGFAKSLDDLKMRQFNQAVQFISGEERRFGPAYVKNNYKKLIDYFNNKKEQFEIQYLPVTERGTPLAADEVEHQFLIHVLKSLASSLDAHTAVFDSNEAYDMRVRLNKGFDGIGIAVSERPEGIYVTGITKDGPAARNDKIHLGDQILKIDGESIDSMNFETVQERLRGQNGTTLTLIIKRPGQSAPVQVTLQRETIVINEGRAEYTYESFGNGIIGTIKLDSFYQGPNGMSSVNDVKNAIEELDKKGNLRGLILDFRENSGGFLSEAIKVAGLFITNGVIVISKYHDGEERFYRDMDTSVAYDGPLVILTSRATASAAEIVAQALQDYGVAVIVGDDHTYGKGTIQSQTVTREDGGGSYFKVTVGKYYTVSGKTPQIQGVHADVVVPGKFSNLTMGEEYLDYPVETAKKDVIDPAYVDALQDIKPNLKSWYMRYYMPTVQKPRSEWKSVIPKLRQNSEYRLEKNKSYQVFLKQLKGEDVSAASDDQEADEYGRLKHDNFGQEDLQKQEAVNVVKDMIYLQPQAEKAAKTASAK